MTVKKADFNYILAEEKEYLGKEIGNFFEEPVKQFCGYENTKVELLGAPDYKEWINSVFYNCFSTWNKSPERYVSAMMETLSFQEKEKKVLYMLSKRPISAVLEYGTFLFRFSGVPRAWTHQAVRHRGMAFSQQSYRVSSCYADPIMIPQELLEMEDCPLKTELIKDCEKLIKQGRATYKKLIENGISMEASRNLMFMGTCTELGAVMRVRDLIDYVKARTSDIAQDYHTYVICLMLAELKVKSPKFYEFIKEQTKDRKTGVTFETLMDKYLKNKEGGSLTKDL